MSYIGKGYEKTWRILAEAFYGSGKKRGSSVPLVAENILEISRSDFERGGLSVFSSPN